MPLSSAEVSYNFPSPKHQSQHSRHVNKGSAMSHLSTFCQLTVTCRENMQRKWADLCTLQTRPAFSPSRTAMID